MQPFITTIGIVGLSLLPAVTALADDVPLVPIPGNAGAFDIKGQWQYTTSGHQVSGICPNGRPMSGTLEISSDDALVQVLIVSGAVCDPASMCVYSGVIEDGDLVVANSAVVDEEGGVATNELRLYFYSETSGGGQSTSTYTHPGGFGCNWSHSLTLSRASPDNGDS